MKFWTKVNLDSSPHPFRLADRIVLMGSCFADSIGARLVAAGFDAMVNPFGTLYNPSSLLSAVRRLDSNEYFGPSDCVEMGAGAGMICSFEHHTSFARPTAESFLDNANKALEQARDFWKTANRVILTLGTSMIWCAGGRTVSNCLKRPASEFTRRMLEVEDSRSCIQSIIDAHPEKSFLVTVSPIRHLGDGAHANTISKSRLILAADACQGADYFPAYEILNDELRDYRFYADDLVHPSTAATDYIWECFTLALTAPEERARMAENEKAARRKAHRSILNDK